MFGVVRLAATSPEALRTAVEFLSSESVNVQKATVRAIGAAQVDHPTIVNSLGTTLRHKDEAVVLETLAMIRRLAPRAAGLKSEVLRICAERAESRTCESSKLTAQQLSR